MIIPDEKVREVAERISIVELVSDYVTLKKNGANYIGLCPFHGEKTPSFNVSPAREAFHCFGCGVGGNAFSFLMKIEGLTFPEAVKFAARKAGVEIEDRQLTSAEKQAQSERHIFQQINQFAAKFYREHFCKSNDESLVKIYLKQRNVELEIEELYGIGFAPENGDTLARELQKAALPLDLAAKLGIVKKNERGGWFDQFRNRLMFPIHDAKGSVIAFAGRVLDNSLPKYVNSPESPFYHKSSVLFGLNLALPAIRAEKSAMIVEGYFDHLALYQAGFKNVVATCGTALTAEHARTIKRHAEKVYLLFDGDAAGRKATIRSMEIFMEQRLPCYLIALPPEDDPDSFIRKNGAAAFSNCVNTARPAFESYMRSLVEHQPPDNVDSKVRIIDEVLPKFRKIADPIERDLYEKEICRLLGITLHAFRKRSIGRNISRSDMTAIPTDEAVNRADSAQETMLSLICAYPDAADRVESLGINSLFDGDYLLLADKICQSKLALHEDTALQHISESLENEKLRSIFSKILVSEAIMADVDWKIALEHCIRSRKKKALSSIKDIAARLSTVEPDSPEYHELLKAADALRTKKSEIVP